MMKVILMVNLLPGLGLLALLMVKSPPVYALPVSGLLIAVSTIIALDIKKRFEGHIQEYKALLTKVLEIKE